MLDCIPSPQFTICRTENNPHHIVTKTCIANSIQVRDTAIYKQKVYPENNKGLDQWKQTSITDARCPLRTARGSGGGLFWLILLFCPYNILTSKRSWFSKLSNSNSNSNPDVPSSNLSDTHNMNCDQA